MLWRNFNSIQFNTTLLILKTRKLRCNSCNRLILNSLLTKLNTLAICRMLNMNTKPILGYMEFSTLKNTLTGFVPSVERAMR
jgi:hypothetical protein